MKLLSLICVIVVMVLNFAPCADAQVKVSTQRTTPHAETEKDHALDDGCSPFCHCNCCSASSIAQLLTLTSIPFKEHKTVYTSYFTGKYVDVSLPVWQPPRL